MHMLEWPSLGFWKKRLCENLCWICFEKFGSSKYNTWTIVPISCLWLVQGVDTTQSHIYYIYSLPNLSKIKFLANLVAGLRGAETPEFFSEIPGFPKIPDLAQSIRTFRVYIPFLLQSTQFHFYSLTATPLSPLPSPPTLPHLALGDFRIPPTKSCESKALEAPRRGDWRSTSDLKDRTPSSLSPQGIHGRTFRSTSL
jgi:hypothetical protein